MFLRTCWDIHSLRFWNYLFYQAFTPPLYGDTRTLEVYAASSSPSNFASKWHSSFVTFPWDGEDKWHSVCNLLSKAPCGTIPSRKITTVKSSESYDVSECVGIFQEGPFNSLLQSIGCGLSAATSGSALSELLEETFDEPLRQCDRCVRQWRALWAWVICVPKESADMYLYIYIYTKIMVAIRQNQGTWGQCKSQSVWVIVPAGCVWDLQHQFHPRQMSHICLILQVPSQVASKDRKMYLRCSSPLWHVSC